MPVGRTNRRAFIAALGSAAAWPLAVRAQQGERVRRIGVLMSNAMDDPQDPTRLAAFAQGLQELGWAIGRNLRIDYRWGAGSPNDMRKYAAELAALAPDMMLASGSAALAAVQQTNHAIPVVFVNVIDPVSGGFVESLARPGGNATGFLLFEYTTSGKLLELLKQIAPSVTRAAILRDRYRHSCRQRAVGRNSVRRVAIGGRISTSRRARRRRDRARHNRFRAWIEWRLDCDGEHASA